MTGAATAKAARFAARAAGPLLAWVGTMMPTVWLKERFDPRGHRCALTITVARDEAAEISGTLSMRLPDLHLAGGAFRQAVLYHVGPLDYRLIVERLACNGWRIVEGEPEPLAAVGPSAETL
jgi:hypothetical protein